MIRLVLAVATATLVLLCRWLAPSVGCTDPVVWSSDLRGAALRAESANRWLCVHFSNPDRPLDGELRRALAAPPVLAKLQAAFVCARVENAPPGTAEEWLGEAACVAVVFVAPGFGPIAAWFGTATEWGSTSSCEQVIEAALAQSAKLQVLRGRTKTDPWAVLELARVHQQLGTGALAERLVRSVASAPGSPPGCRAEAWVMLARSQAARGFADRARTALSECRILAPERVCAPDVAVTEAMIAVVELKPDAAIAGLDAQSSLVTDGALSRLLRSDALHLRGNAAGALVVLHELLADSNAVQFHTTVRARITHLLSPDHGHAH